MMRFNNQLPIRWVQNLEVGVTVMWLLYFFHVALPDPFPQLINAASYPIIAILVFIYRKHLLWVATRDLPLLILVGFVLASIFWSSNPGSTINSCRGFVRMFLFGAYFTTRYDLKMQMKVLTWAFSIAAILSVVVVFALPSYGISPDLVHQGAWKGIFAQKGMLGDAMSVGAMLFLFTALSNKTRKWLSWLGCGALVFINLMTDSSSSLISFLFLLSLVPLYLLVKQQYQLKVILLSMGCILAAMIAIFILGNLDTILVEVLNQETDGRLSIWSLMLEKILAERPLFGYGLNAFWSSDAGAFVGTHAWSEARVATEFNAHSSYMELFAGLGILGAIVYAISLVSVSTRTVMLLISTKKIEFFWFVQFLIFAHIAAISNVGKIASGATSYLAIYVSICLSTAVEWKRMRMGMRQYPMIYPKESDRKRYRKSKIPLS